MKRDWIFAGLLWGSLAIGGAGGCVQAPPKPTGPPTDYSVSATPSSQPGLSNFAQVSTILYRGAQPTRQGFERLKTMGIKTIVDLRGASHRDGIDGLGFQYVRISSSAADPERSKVVQFLRILRDPDSQPVFVHDDRGADRVGLFVAAYRRVEQGWSAKDAEAEMNVFHFSPFWSQITAFIEHMDVSAIRRAVEQPETRPQTRATKRNGP